MCKAFKKRKIVRNSLTFFTNWENVNKKFKKFDMFYTRFWGFPQLFSKVSIVDQQKLSGLKFRHAMVNGILKIDAIYYTKAARQPRKDPCKAKIGNSRNLNYLPCFSYYRKMNTISVIYAKFYSKKCVLKIRNRTTPKFCCMM